MDFTQLKDGQEFALEIERSPSHSYMEPDAVAAGSSMSGYLEMAFFSFRSRFEKHNFKAISNDGIAMAIQAGGVEASPSIVEVGAIRVTPEVALTMISVLAKQLTLTKTRTSDDIKAHLTANGVDL